jgi:hypothetical protein
MVLSIHARPQHDWRLYTTHRYATSLQAPAARSLPLRLSDYEPRDHEEIIGGVIVHQRHPVVGAMLNG